MRSFDDVANINGKREQQIPDIQGAVVGLTGVKAPFGYKQESDIRDRLQSAGVLIPTGVELKR